ncbi:MAG: ComF family protein [Terracidiphilus sp.]
MASITLSGYTVAKVARKQPRHLEVRCVFRRDSGSLTFDVPPSEVSSWRAIARVLRSPMDALGCALFPASCALCGSPLPQLSPVPICAVCWTEFPIQAGPACALCGDTLDVPISDENPASYSLCRACRLAPPPYVRAVSYGLYQDRMKAAIHALKYDRMHPAARGLGRMLAQAIAQFADQAPAEMLVIPIPLHRSKYAQRGFNQARALAENALGFLRKSHPQWHLTLANSALMRHRSTESQAGLTLRGRRMNVRGAFTVSNPAAVDSKDILLIDDIFTTGATARAAAQVLVRAGATSVWVATLARARRIYEINQSAHLEGAQDDIGLTGNGPAADGTQAGIYSSHRSSQDQPSF